MTSVQLELLRHKTWATLRLVEHCSSLPPEELDARVPGTYGSIIDTLRHLLRSDATYMRNITGQPLEPPQPAADADLRTLADRFQALAPRWEEIFQDPSIPEREFTSRQGTFKCVVSMAQSIHHADDHRTQVLSILGARGLEVPDLDVWHYHVELGDGRYPV